MTNRLPNLPVHDVSKAACYRAQLGAGHTPLGGAVHEGADRHATCTLLVSLHSTPPRLLLHIAWHLKTTSVCVCDHGYIMLPHAVLTATHRC